MGTGCRNHDDFLTRLGQQRIWFLKGRIQDDSWTSELSERAARLSLPEEATPAERIVFASSRKLQDIVTTKKYQLALCGIGVSNLAAWLAYYDLRRAGYALNWSPKSAITVILPASGPLCLQSAQHPSCG